MPTTPLYLTDSYLKEFDANVQTLNGQEILLDSTAFYPGGGGQPPDRGVLRTGGATLSVVEVRKEGEGIVHKIAEPTQEPISRVHGIIDWNLRYAHMRHHTALHILSGVVYHEFNSLVTGGQIYPDRARLDFDLEDLSPERLTKIVDAANKVVMDSRPVSVRFLSRGEAFNIESLLRTKVNLIPESVQQIRIVVLRGLMLRLMEEPTCVIRMKSGEFA